MSRAGILAEASSFFLIAPEILGTERLRAAEGALRQGLNSRIVRGTIVSVWAVFALALWLGATLLALAAGRFIWGFLSLPLVMLSAFSSYVCRGVVRRPLFERPAESARLFVGLGRMARFSLTVVNPLEFRRVMRPTTTQWAFWILGLPFHLLAFFVYFVAPVTLLWLVRLGQVVVVEENRLRAFVFAGGVVLLLGGMATEFVATF